MWASRIESVFGVVAATGSGVDVAVAVGPGVDVAAAMGTVVGVATRGSGWPGVKTGVGDGAGIAVGIGLGARIGVEVGTSVGATEVHAARSKADDASIQSQSRGPIKRVPGIALNAWNNIKTVELVSIHQLSGLHGAGIP